MKYASNNIRNILIAGHAGSGKTTLTEALVYFSGAAERMGRVEDGTTISDFDPEEAKRKASLSASVVPVEYEGIKYNLIDAPGLGSFRCKHAGFVICCKCRFGGKGVDCIIGGLAPSGCAPEGTKNFLLPLTRKRKGGMPHDV